MSFRYGSVEEVTVNRQRWFQTLGLRDQGVFPLSLDVTYGVHWLEKAPTFNGVSNPGFGSEGVWLANPSKALFLIVADCFPVAFYDPEAPVIGVFHAGRAELQAGLLTDFLRLGVEHGVSSRSLVVFIGPGVCERHYHFRQLPANNTLPVRPDQDGFHLDLSAAIYSTLAEFGISSEQVQRDNRCTFESRELFSHRREKGLPEGRFALIARSYG